MKSYSKQPRAQARRERTVERLESQLKDNTKPNPEKLPGNDVFIPLNENDIKRIKKELSTLKDRIQGKN